jgi:hypothetical protein
VTFRVTKAGKVEKSELPEFAERSYDSPIKLEEGFIWGHFRGNRCAVALHFLIAAWRAKETQSERVK